MEREQKNKPPEEPDEEEFLGECGRAKEHVPNDAVPKPVPDGSEIIWKRI